MFGKLTRSGVKIASGFIDQIVSADVHIIDRVGSGRVCMVLIECSLSEIGELQINYVVDFVSSGNSYPKAICWHCDRKERRAWR